VVSAGAWPDSAACLNERLRTCIGSPTRRGPYHGSAMRAATPTAASRRPSRARQSGARAASHATHSSAPDT